MSKWIPVDEELPEIEGSYSDTILYFGELHGVRGRYNGVCDDTATFWSMGNKARNVTYWQPLPKPPTNT